MSSESDSGLLAASVESILRSIPAGVVVLRKPEGKIVFVNDRAVELCGVNPRGLQLQEHSEKMRLCSLNGELYPPERLPTSRALLKGENVFEEEMLIQRPDGSNMYVNVCAVPFTDENGAVFAAVGIFEDVTKPKKAEDLYRRLLETSFDAFWLADANGRFFDVNNAFTKLLGYSREEILKMSISDIDAQETPRNTYKHLQEIKKKGYDYFETRHRRKDGQIIEIQASANYLKVDGGRFFGFLHDITRRKHNEAAIKQNEERFRFIAKAAATMVYEVEVESGKTTIAYGLKELVGYDPDEIPLSRDWWLSQIHPQDRREVESELARAIATTNDTAFEYRFRRKRGDYIAVHDTIKIVTDAKGKAVRIVGGAIDVTERRMAEAVVAEAKANLEKERDLLQSVMNGAKRSHLVYLDRDFNFVRVNEAYAKTCGYKPEDMIGKNHFNLYPNDENEAIFAKVRDTGLPIEFRDKPFVFPDQPKRGITYWDWTLEPIKDASGKVEGLVFTLVETTERKKLEEQLKLSEERYRAAVEGCNDGIWDRDLKTRQVFFSDQWKRILGYAPEEIADDISEFDRLIHPEDKEKTWTKINAHIRGETPYYATEFRMKHKDGAWRWILSRGSVLRDENGVPCRIAGSHTDITERKLTDEKLQHYTEQLEALVDERTQKLKEAERLAAIGQTAGMVGHDIRNPLQSIIGEIYLAKTELKNLPESSAKKCLEESCESIAKSVDYVNKIVMDLQDYAKKLKPIFQEISLKNFLAESLSRNDIPENIHTSCKVEANAKNISTDPTLLKRILDNLVMNAIQAMPKGGALTIHAFNKADRLCITIQDTGVGIPEDVKSKLFKPLFTTKSKGQGLGLAVVKRLTEAMNGNITFESNEGKGTTFTVELPMTGTA